MELGHTANTWLCNTAWSRTARSWPSDELSRVYLSECTPLKIFKGLVSNFVQQVLAFFQGVARPCNSQKSPQFWFKFGCIHGVSKVLFLLFSYVEVE